MTKRIQYTGSDEVTYTVTPAENWRNPGESDDAFLARVIAKDVPQDATDVTIIDE